ncbi:MAG: GumC family protein, partial [Rubrimonas sp.]
MRPAEPIAVAAPAAAAPAAVPGAWRAARSPDVARDLSRLARGLWRRRWLIVALGALGAAASVALALALPDRYTAYGRISVGPETFGGAASELSVLPQAQLIALETEVQALWDGALLVEVARALDLPANPEFSPALAERRAALAAETPETPPDAAALRSEIMLAFVNSMKVEVLGQSRIIEASVSTSSPGLAADIVNTLLGTHVARRREAVLNGFANAQALVDREIDALSAALTETERALAEQELVAGGRDGATALRATLAEIDRQLVEVGARLAAAEASVAAVSGGGADGGGPGAQMGEAQTIQSLLAAQAAARARLDAVRRAEGARSRDYALAEQEVAEADAAVAGAREAMLRGRLEALRRAEAERGHLRAARAALLERIEGQAAAAAALHPLRREVESRSAALLALQTRSDALSAQRALWEPNVVVASEAAVPAEPSGPNRKLIAVAGTVAFGALTLLVAFLLEALRGTIGVRRDVEADFAIPALAELPAPPRRGGEDMAALMTQAPDNPYARAVRALSYAVFPRGGAGVLLFAGVGADPRGARARLCLGLAHALAADGARVALVSATGPAIGERAGAAAGPA